MSRKLVTLCLLCSIMVPSSLVATARPARADWRPIAVATKGTPRPTPKSDGDDPPHRPKPKPKPGPRGGGEDE